MSSPDAFGLFDDDRPDERQAAEWLIEQLLGLSAQAPQPQLRDKILSKLNFAGEELDPDHLPPTSRYANHLSWLKFLAPFMPGEPVETLFMHEFRRDEQYVQSLVVSKVNVPEEIHETYTESFFILEGRCACSIGGQVFELAAGDYLDIPLHVPHDVRLLTPQVTAIIQYQLIS